MREIKFRAWVKRKNELIYLKGFRYSGNEKIKITFTDEDKDDCTYTFLNKDVYLEQFTGLHDKNRVEIYEGDIIKLFEHKGIIQYECGSFGIVFTDCIDWEEIEENICPVTGCDNDLHACKNDNFISLWEIYWNFNDEDDYLNTVEVIGNIYENPDLLEVTNED